MYGYIYKTTNLVDGLIYIGQKHSSKFLGQEYLGSGKLLRRAVEKYGKENFKVDLLEEIETKDLMDEREIYWISYYHATDHAIGYNISEGGNVNRTMVGENNPFYGKTHSKETIDKILTANVGKTPWNKGLTKNSDMRVQKYSITHTGKESVCKNTTWINNGSKTKMVAKNKLQDYLDAGWVLGRLSLPKENYSKAAAGTIRINNGVIEKRINKELVQNYLDDGWILGRLKFKDTSNFGKHLRKKVKCIETGIIYESAAEVYRQLHIRCDGCCKGFKETASGYHWKYVEE